MTTERTKSGIEIVGDIPWGTHFCHFYETMEDMFDILIPYFKAGLENNEFCMWVVFPPQSVEQTLVALRGGISGIDRRLAAGDIEILSHTQWYFKGGSFNIERVIEGWMEKFTLASHGGYAGLRVNGNGAWLTREIWNELTEYEERLNNVIANRRMIVLCTYLLSLLSASQVFDVISAHQLALAKRYGKWEVLESQELKKTKAELKRANEQLEQRVAQRTRDLHEKNTELQALANRFAGVVEEERRGLSRELHDCIGQNLVALALDMKAISDSLTPQSDTKVRNFLVEARKLLEETTEHARDLMIELRPPDLEEYGLAKALRWYTDRFSLRTGVRVSVECGLEAPRLPSQVETALFRIAQEALTNISRHPSAGRVDLTLQFLPDLVRLTIADNGAGFDPCAVPRPPAAKAGWGLINMRERAEGIGGQLQVESAPGKGTWVTFESRRGFHDTSLSG